MKNSNMKRQGAKIIFALITVALFGWTAYLTVSFLSMALPGAFWIAPYLGLVIFDAGTIGWLFVYLYLAEGSMQRTIALGLTVFNLIGVGLVTMAEIVLGGQTLTAAPEGLGTAAIWGIGLWTFVNVAAIVGFHASSPEARLAAAIQDEKDAVTDMALQNMQARREANALALSEQLGAGMYNTLITELMKDADGDGVPDMYERKANRGPRITHTERPQLTAEQAAQVAAYLSLAQPVDTGNSTHAAPRHDAPAAPPSAGQGQRPNGPPAPTIGRRSPDGAPDF